MQSETKTQDPHAHLPTSQKPLRDIHPDPANLRQQPVRNLDAIKASLRRFGQQKPIVVDAQGTILAGHGVFLAARDLGWDRLACVTSNLSGPERIAYQIADNRAAELSTWDEAALFETLGQMDVSEAAELGFSNAELSSMHDALNESLDEDAPIAPAKHAVAQLGDLWHLGEHRLLCGDSTDARDVDRLMDGHQAALVATDPPYLVDYTGDRPNDSGKDWSATFREFEITDADGFFRGVFTNVLRVLAPHAAIYCWHAHKRQALISRVWEDLGILEHQQIIWVKPTPVFGRVYWHFRHEPCLMGWRQGSQPEHKRNGMAGGEHDSVWEIDWEGASRIVGNEHPTQKPLELFARPMRKHTEIGDIVLEPFSGSGSQLIAATRLRRRCMAIELEPVFVDVAIRRWQQETGQDARLSDGTPWREVACNRNVLLGDDGAPMDIIAPRVKDAPCPPDSPANADAAAAPASRKARPTTAGNTSGKRGKARIAIPTTAPASAGTVQNGERPEAASS